MNGKSSSDERNQELERKRESGLPGGGAGRIEEVKGSGVYPMSGPHPPGDAPIIPEPAWGQGKRGSAGYDDHGESEIYMVNVRPEKCRDLMTKDPLCCVSSDSAMEAANLMGRSNIGAVPVVEDIQSKKLIGILTDRDLALKVVAEGRDPARTRVQEIMSYPLVTCSPDDELETAVRSMERNRVRRIPVCDNTGRIVGIISQADIAIRVRSSPQTAELLEAVSTP
jgi:CBS domain-containing protein